MNLAEILEEIELLRQELNAIGRKRNLLDEEVIKISQQLDQLFNIYQRQKGK